VYAGEVKINRPEKEKAVRKKTKTKIKVNVAFPNVPEEAKTADGVGLLRIEHMIIKSGVHPAKLIRDGRTEEYIKILTDGIRPIAKAFKQKPIWVRTLDARSDEFRNLQGGEDEPHEDNPMLGWHGIRRSLDEPELLKAEFEAIKRLHAEGFTSLHVMLPFIVSVDEFEKAKKLAEQVELNCKLGIMIETASAALIIEDFCKAGIAFGSVGSNDLTQSVLCVDRNNDKIAGLYDTYHPAVLKLIKNMIAVCKKYGVESSICGEAGSEEKMAEILVSYGIDSISTNIDALDKIRAVITKTEKS
jgi:pyruvate,water dikinase